MGGGFAQAEKIIKHASARTHPTPSPYKENQQKKDSGLRWKKQNRVFCGRPILIAMDMGKSQSAERMCLLTGYHGNCITAPYLMDFMYAISVMCEIASTQIIYSWEQPKITPRIR